MQLLSSTDLALGLALKGGSLRIVERQGRFGSFVSLEDAAGIIEVHETSAAAEARLAPIREAVAQ